MRKFILIVSMFLLVACGASQVVVLTNNTGQAVAIIPSVVVANRNAQSISIIDIASDTVTDTIPMPAAAQTALPGYVVYSAIHHRIYVGDSTNDRIVIFDATDFSHLGDLPVVDDVFHMWLNNNQLWSTDRVDNSIAVFDLNTDARVAVIPIPADLRALGGQPHDIVVDENHAYVTILNVGGGPDMVIKYDVNTFTEVDRAPVGEDPHVFLHPTNSNLYVACQDTDNVFVIDRNTMTQITVVPIFGGHGVWVPNDGRTLYVSNFPGHVAGGLPGPGFLGLFAVKLDDNTPIGGITTPFPATHNITSDPDGKKLYVTHSEFLQGKVSIYDISDQSVVPTLLNTIDVGTNPFGIAYFPRR